MQTITIYTCVKRAVPATLLPQSKGIQTDMIAATQPPTAGHKDQHLVQSL